MPVDSNISKYSNLNAIVVKLSKHLDSVKSKAELSENFYDFPFSVTFNSNITITRLVPKSYQDYKHDLKITTVPNGSVIIMESLVYLGNVSMKRVSQIFSGANSVTCVTLDPQAFSYIDKIT